MVWCPNPVGISRHAPREMSKDRKEKRQKVEEKPFTCTTKAFEYGIVPSNKTTNDNINSSTDDNARRTRNRVKTRSKPMPSEL